MGLGVGFDGVSFGAVAVGAAVVSGTAVAVGTGVAVVVGVPAAGGVSRAGAVTLGVALATAGADPLAVTVGAGPLSSAGAGGEAAGFRPGGGCHGAGRAAAVAETGGLAESGADPSTPAIAASADKFALGSVLTDATEADAEAGKLGAGMTGVLAERGGGAEDEGGVGDIESPEGAACVCV